MKSLELRLYRLEKTTGFNDGREDRISKFIDRLAEKAPPFKGSEYELKEMRQGVKFFCDSLLADVAERKKNNETIRN